MINKAVEILNLILKEEPEALTQLINTRYIITSKLIINNHDILTGTDKGINKISLLGIINSIVKTDKEIICVHIDDDDDKPEKFGIATRYCHCPYVPNK
jgi:hypothetical protein